jgi:hypothetical protein
MECLLSIFSRKVTLSSIVKASIIALADLPGNTRKVYAYVYRRYAMSHEYFRVFRVQTGVLSQTCVLGTPNSPPRLLSGNCISWWDLFVYFSRHSEYLRNSIPKNSESIWWIQKITKIEFSYPVQIQTRWAP